MKSILEGQKKDKTPESKYPYIGINKTEGRVVLFSGKNTGTVLHAAKGEFEVGHHTTYWREDDCYEKLNGVIKLSN